MTKRNKITVGQWVRFYQAGRLVIGVVQYVGPDEFGHQEISTDVGTVDADSVLETR